MPLLRSALRATSWGSDGKSMDGQGSREHHKDCKVSFEGLHCHLSCWKGEGGEQVRVSWFAMCYAMLLCCSRCTAGCSWALPVDVKGCQGHAAACASDTVLRCDHQDVRNIPNSIHST